MVLIFILLLFWEVLHKINLLPLPSSLHCFWIRTKNKSQVQSVGEIASKHSNMWEA